MRHHRWLRLSLAAVLTIAVSACGGGGGDEDVVAAAPPSPDDGAHPASESAPSESASESGPPVGDASALAVDTSEYAFDLPDEMDGGIVETTVTNSGAVPHEVGFVKVATDYDIEQFGADFAPVLEGGPIPAAFENVTGVAEVEPGDSHTSTITLPEGTYAVFCALTDPVADEGGEGPQPPPHYDLGMLRLATVTGGVDATAEDITGTDATMSAFDYGFEVDELTALGAGSHAVTFHNVSDQQFHHAVVFGFPEGVDEQGAREAFQALMEAEGPPPEGEPEPDEAGYSGVFGPGMGGAFDVDLESGRTYATVCFIQDREGGPPHALAHDMAEFFTVQ